MLLVVSGDGQVRQSGAELPSPLGVAVEDGAGNPLRDAEISFTANGGGLVTPAVARSDASGRAYAIWTLGDVLGAQTLQATVGALQADFTAIAVDIELTVAGDLDNRRYLTGDMIDAAVTLAGFGGFPEDSIRWTTASGTELGSGQTLRMVGLPPGKQRITVSVLGQSATDSVRMFTDLWDLYKAEPTRSEIDRILADFDIRYVDGPLGSWTGIDFDFDTTSSGPSRLPIVARLDVLRRQHFGEPPAFTGGQTAYDWMRSVVQVVNVRLSCENNSGGGGHMNLNYSAATWLGVFAGSACTEFTEFLFPYVPALQLYVHEARHSEPGDPRHTTCPDGAAGDATLFPGSGYAFGAHYSMWLHKYALHDPPAQRMIARSQAVQLLDRICATPTHPDPRVQAIIQELLGADPPSQ